MKHLIINKLKSASIQDGVEEISVRNEEKGKVFLQRGGNKMDVNVQLRGRNKIKGDEFDGKHIRW